RPPSYCKFSSHAVTFQLLMHSSERPIFLAALLLCGCFGRKKPFLKSKDPSLKIPAIKMAVGAHDLDACADLVKDLDSEDPAVRFYAIQGLHKLTGETFDYRYYDDEIARKASLARWKAWLAAQKGPTTRPATEPTENR